MLRQLFIFFVGSLFSVSLLAAELSIKTFARTNFNPSLAEGFDFSVTAPAGGELEVRIVSADGDDVLTLYPKKSVAAGEIKLRWNGKDAKGETVPDEAWFPVITFYEGKKQPAVLDPRESSGGEVIDAFPTQVDPSGSVRFELPYAARVLARAGVKAGPMMRSLADWAPRTAGSNVLAWDGLDQNGVVRVLDHPDAAVMVTAYRLQDFAIITMGNEKQTYAAYRKVHGWPEKREGRRVLGKERNGKALSAAFFDPKYWPLSPQASLDLKAPVEDVNGARLAVVEQPVTVEVNVLQEQRWILEKALFEVGFFIDYKFVAEEEQGYLPFVWKLDSAGLTPGEHVLTVNISGFDGQIALASTRFIVTGPAGK